MLVEAVIRASTRFNSGAPRHQRGSGADLRLGHRRPNRNNIIEQDHRAIKRRVNAKQGFREFQAARRTIQGYEAMNIIRKGQVRWLSGSGVRRQNRFIDELFEVAG
jgi:transposase-like protein